MEFSVDFCLIEAKLREKNAVTLGNFIISDHDDPGNGLLVYFRKENAALGLVFYFVWSDQHTAI
jgi:hypothetical protein